MSAHACNTAIAGLLSASASATPLLPAGWQDSSPDEASWRTRHVSGQGSDLFLGLDFGTDSVRALLVDDRGRIGATAVAPYEHGQITVGSAIAQELFVDPLPRSFALQDPSDWLASAAIAV